MPKIETLARSCRMMHLTTTTPQQVNSLGQMLAFKVRASSAPYYVWTRMGNKTPEQNPGDFVNSGDNEFGPYPVPVEEDGVIGYHEVGDHGGNVYIQAADGGTIKIEVFFS
jgi:hypothetical protein